VLEERDDEERTFDECEPAPEVIGPCCSAPLREWQRK